MKKLCSLFAALSIGVCLTVQADTDYRDLPDEWSYQYDINLGIEAFSVGNNSLAKEFLVPAVNAYEAQGVFQRWFNPLLSSADFSRTVDTLLEIHWEEGEYDHLLYLIGKYPVTNSSNSIEDEENVFADHDERKRVSQAATDYKLYHTRKWFCSTLEVKGMMHQARDCWDSIADHEKADAATRIIQYQSLFGGG